MGQMDSVGGWKLWGYVECLGRKVVREAAE